MARTMLSFQMAHIHRAQGMCAQCGSVWHVQPLLKLNEKAFLCLAPEKIAMAAGNHPGLAVLPAHSAAVKTESLLQG